MSIGFIPHDWEIANDDTYYCECYAPESVFNEPYMVSYMQTDLERLFADHHLRVSATHRWFKSKVIIARKIDPPGPKPDPRPAGPQPG